MVWVGRAVESWAILGSLAVWQAHPSWVSRVSELVSVAGIGGTYVLHAGAGNSTVGCGNDALTDCATAAAPVQIFTSHNNNKKKKQERDKSF